MQKEEHSFSYLFLKMVIVDLKMITWWNNAEKLAPS